MNRLEALFLVAPVHRAALPRRAILAVTGPFRWRRNILVRIDGSTTIVRGSDQLGRCTLRARGSMEIRHSQGKGGRKHRASHQSDLQALSPSRVDPRRKDTKSSTDLPGA